MIGEAHSRKLAAKLEKDHDKSSDWQHRILDALSDTEKANKPGYCNRCYQRCDHCDDSGDVSDQAAHSRPKLSSGLPYSYCKCSYSSQSLRTVFPLKIFDLISCAK